MNALDHAIALYSAGNHDAAEAAARQCAEGDTTGAALNLLAVIAQDAQRSGEAEQRARAALALAPGHPIYLNTLGNSLIAQGRGDEAVAVLTEANNAAPLEADILFNLANAQGRAGREGDAIESYRACIAQKPGHIGAYNNLALILKNAGDAESAATVLIEAVAHAPTSAELRFNLGNTLQATGRLDAAAAAYRRTIALRPGHAEAHTNLGVVLADMGQRDAAEACFRRAIAINPDIAPAYVGLADLVDDGSMDAVAHRRAVLALKPDLAAIRSSLLMCLHYTPDASRADLFEEHKAYGALFAPLSAATFAADHDFTADRPLRIGVVSGDLRFHAMLFFALPVFEARDRAAWHLTCYSATAKPDVHTQSFRAAADAWRDVRALTSDQLAALVAHDRIDILIDLSGHAPHNRLPAFAVRPAPLQVAWGDYVDTRGLAVIDVLLGDGVHTPPADDGYYTERVVRFAPDYICYRPPPYAPAVAPAPFLTNGCVTFGCFSEVTKIGPAAVALWAACLRAVPEARFLLNNNLLADANRRSHILNLFRERGIGSDRLIFREGGPHREFLGQYADVDIILDTAPYSGGLTTCEALLMGVPVLTVAGDRFCSRHAGAHVTHGGFPEGAASDAADLTAKAAALAAAGDELVRLRGALRSRLLASTVCDIPRFADAFYGALRAAWTERCRLNR